MGKTTRNQLDATMSVRPSGTRQWRNRYGYHRLDGPAIVFAGGGEEWWINGQLHRVDGPAVETCIGCKEWYLHDKRHRLGGPAVEYRSTLGQKIQYWVRGVRFTENEYYLYVDQLTGEVLVPPGKKLTYEDD